MTFARRLLAAALSAALVLLSPGLEAPRVFAQTLRAAPVEGLAVPAAPAAGASLAPSAPALGSALTLSAPAAPLSAPALAAPTAQTLPAAAAAAAPLAAAAADGDAYGAGRGLEDVLTGARSAVPSDAPAAVPAFAPAAAVSALSAPVAGNEAGRAEAAKTAADAPASAPAPKSVDSAVSYKIHRLLLQTVARLTGAVDSLPPAGPALTEDLIKSASDRRAVISDYDDTLAAFNERLPADMVAAVQAIHAAGKTFDVISDRGDEKRGNTLTLFESLDTVPAETRAGMYVAANSGGRVYRYDETGTPVKVYEAPAMTDEVKAHIAAAAAATKARLAEAGTTQHDGVGKIPAESWGPYSYALMLKPGSSEASVKATAAILQAELDKKGIDVEVNPRFAKDPANPPYVTLSLITKEGAARYIAQARKAGPEDAVILGDSMYVPHAPKKESWLTRLGERASGQARPALGNRTDANMERGVPGALTLSVGTTGDPRTKNLYVLAGKGPSVTRRVLESVASKPAPGGARAALGYGEKVDLEKARLTNLYAAEVAKIPGAKSLAVEALSPYGLGHAAFLVQIRFDDADSVLAAVRAGLLNRELPAASDGSPVRMGWSLAAEKIAAHLAAAEEKLKREFSEIPGADGVRVVEYSAYAMGVNARSLEIYFKDQISLDAARAAGRLPENVEINAGAGELSRSYDVRAKVGAPPPVASEKADAPAPFTWRHAFLHLYGPVALIAAVVGTYYLLMNSAAGLVAGWESQVHQIPNDIGAFFGAGVLAYGFGSAHFVVNPATDYQEARKKAVELAVKRGAAESDVLFVQATAALPEQDGRHWHYQFEIPGKNGGKALVYVDSSRFLGGPADLRTSVFEGASAAEGKRATALEAYMFGRGAQVDPQAALDAVRREAPEFGARASVALDYRKETQSGDEDLWYRFYDDKGGVASVNARTSEVRVEAGAKRATALSASISRASPVDGFSSFVYAEALQTARGLAAKGGYSPDNLRVEGATLSPRAWGEDWTFHFVAPRESAMRDPRGYTVTVRRTMVSETQLDAIASSDDGPRRMFSAVPAAALPELVKITPLEAIAKTGPDARTLELQARWPKDGPAQLWYVVRGDKGRELMAIHAGTGAVEKPEPYAALKHALATLGLFAVAAAVYGAIYWAIAHAPAESSTIQYPDGWQGGAVPSGLGFGLFGGLLAGVVARARKPAAKPTDDDVRARASAVSSYKGYPWSQTEYNSAYYPALQNLKEAGASAEQIALFEKLCADAPLRGGRFNPRSGD